MKDKKTIFFCIVWFIAGLTINIIALLPMTFIERAKVKNSIFPYEGDEFITYCLPIFVGSLLNTIICKYVFRIS